MKIRLAILLIAITLVSQADSLEWADSDSGIVGPKHSEILQSLQKVSADFFDRTELVDYGTSLEGRPLQMLLLYRRDLRQNNRPTLYLTGSIHGNEYLNLEDRLPRAITERSYQPGPLNEFIVKGGVFIFVPIVNPDGYDRRQRGNYNGVDLNRDWDVAPANFKGFKEVETQALSQKLLALRQSMGLSYQVTVDYHCCIGALLHPWSYLKHNTMSAVDIYEHKRIGEHLTSLLGSEIAVGTTSDILNYHPMGTTKDYFYDTYGALSFTYEGRYGKENRYFNQHLAWWEKIAAHVLAGRRQVWRLPLLKLAFD